MIAFIIVALNDLEIFACDIDNEHLNAKCRGEIWTEVGTDFGT